eukprot:g10944.t1
MCWRNGRYNVYDWTWLRVNCPSFVHESGQRTVFPGDVAPEVKPLQVAIDDSLVTITWSDGHVSVFKTDWLKAHDNSPSALHERHHWSSPTPLCAWDGVPKVDAREYMEDEEALYKALRKLNRTGAILLENVGVKEKAVLDLARRVAPISHEALYGEHFDVISQENPRNVAYTSERLRLHMDLAYYESPPGLQFLHCLEFDAGVKGGATTLLDAFAAAEHFRDHFQDKFEVLSRIPATFEKARTAAPRIDGEDRNLQALSGAQMRHQRPVFQVSATGELLAVTWAPMFEGVLMCSAKDMASYHSAHSEFLRLIEEGPYAESHTLHTRLQPGQCLLFNNRRMLHGREAFSSSSPSSEIEMETETETETETSHRRRLQGCYVNADDAMSRLCSLHVGRYPRGSGGGDGSDPVAHYLTRVGNGSLPLVY